MDPSSEVLLKQWGVRQPPAPVQQWLRVKRSTFSATDFISVLRNSATDSIARSPVNSGIGNPKSPIPNPELVQNPELVSR
jgi:hypothetical protein